jgi:hypothetical protein
VLRSDNGTKYINKTFGEYLSAQGIYHQTICLTHQHKWSSRKEEHIIKTVGFWSNQIPLRLKLRKYRKIKILLLTQAED